MSDLHVVYRVDNPDTDDETWSTYSFPHSIYVGGNTLAEVRSEFHEAARPVAVLDGMRVLEHIERPVSTVPGAYVRVAIDRKTLDRDVARDRIAGSLTVRSQREDFVKTVPLAATGDAVIVAAVADDKLGWVFEQMTDHDSIAICLAGPEAGGGALVSWNYIVGSRSERFVESTDKTSLAEKGLTANSTVSEFMGIASKVRGRQLLLTSA